MQSTPKTQNSTPSASPAPGPRRSQRVIQQPERTLSGAKPPTYPPAKPTTNAPTYHNHPNAHVQNQVHHAGSSGMAVGNPVPAHPQAQTATYMSRLRTGSTLLMQPMSTTNQTVTAANANNALRAPARRGGVVNYAEGASDDEFGVDSEDDEDFANTGVRGASSKRSTPRAGGGSSFRVGSPAGLPSSKDAVKQELDRSYLGLIPPTRYITSKNVGKTRHEYPSHPQSIRIANIKEVLIPIRIDLDTETHRIRDCFTWNLNEEFLTPEVFAKIFCQDLDLPHFPYVDQVSGAIRAQLEEHAVVAAYDLNAEDDEPQPEISPDAQDGDDVVVIPRPRRTASDSRQAKPTSRDDGNGAEEDEEEASDAEIDEAEQMDCRVLLALDVQINKHHLLDIIEWDLSPSALAPPSAPLPSPFSYASLSKPAPSPNEVPWDLDETDVLAEKGRYLPSSPHTGIPYGGPITPEVFARLLARDLGLTGEAVPLIAVSLHEELLKHKKDAIEWGILGASREVVLSARARARSAFGPGPRKLRGVWRDWNEVEEFTPRLEVMTQEELEKREVERERIARRLRRDTSKYVKSAATGRKRR